MRQGVGCNLRVRELHTHKLAGAVLILLLGTVAVAGAQAAPGSLISSAFIGSFRELYAKRLAASYPALSKRLAENKSGLSGHGLPALVLQGGTDFIVTCATQLKLVDALRKTGSPVRRIVYPEVPHKGIRQAGFAASVDWMARLARGEPAPVE